jgi:hypothetical protein
MVRVKPQRLRTYVRALEQVALMWDLNQAVREELGDGHYATMVAVGWRAFSPSRTIKLTSHSGRQCLKLEVNTRFLLKTRNNLEQVFGVRIS